MRERRGRTIAESLFVRRDGPLALFQPAKNGNRVFDVWLTYINLLENDAPVRVLFYYFLIRHSVVAPTQRNSPRAKQGFNMFDASIAPSAAPAHNKRV